MAKLEEITENTQVLGLDPNGPVTIIMAKRRGDSALEAVWRDSQGVLREGLLYRSSEPALDIQKKRLNWTFDGDGAALRLASEAWRIHYAHLFDPYLAVHTSDVEPLPHQISAVYQEMLPRLPLRFVLADDPGAGKTIMTGLLIKELIARGDLCRCLIVCPGNLVEQWQDELYRKFHLRFDILGNDRFQGAVTGNAFEEANLAICRLDKLSRNPELQEKLKVTDWDLIVCDEAHKMSASFFGGEVIPTKRFQLGKLLSAITRHFLLLTATPHSGIEANFQLFLSLLDDDRFRVSRPDPGAINSADVMRRLVKEELLKFDGSPLFPDRQAITLNYDLSPLEAELYEAVTAYVRSEFNRADSLNKKQSINVGFALTVLQRRLASSPEAIYQSLRRRRERLQKRLEEEGRVASADELYDPEDLKDEADLPAEELEAAEDVIADQASAARTLEELEAEIATLTELEALAWKTRASGTDRKWEELSGLLQEESRMFGASGEREKLIIFTEHRDTLRYLAERIRSLLGGDEAVATIYGGMSRDERRRVEASFRQDRAVRVLVATDAAGEGINLQTAHLMVNYDLPWNPNRLEQRFGRIHRIGQNNVCWLWNLVASQTREGAVFQRLFEKLEQEKAALGGKVFDVLGKVSFNNRPLRDLLLEAVRHNATSEDGHINRVIDAAFDRDAMIALLAEHALTNDVMDASLVQSMREEMERMEARRLQPYYIESFFREAFTALDGNMTQREKGRFEITRVPARLRKPGKAGGRGEPVLARYNRVCFDKMYRKGRSEADLVCPGHPLLDAVIEETRAKYADLLKAGAILIDENDPGDDCRLLFYLESAIQDGTVLSNGQRREVSRQIHFVALDASGCAVNAGHAPYLDYRPATAAEKPVLLEYIRKLAWLTADIEERAVEFAATRLVPAHVEEVKRVRLPLIEKTAKAVDMRLLAEIQYWDRRANELREKERAGQRNASLNAGQAEAKAEELAARRRARLAELDLEKNISALPARITGGCLIVPQGLLNKLLPEQARPDFCCDAESRKAIEAAAMAAVMACERRLGYEPKDVSQENRGYDIESLIPEAMRKESGECLRFIEVKGRAKGADSVTITHNEILIAVNEPERHILALVEVDGERNAITYLKKCFNQHPDFSLRCSSHYIDKLLASGEIILKQECRVPNPERKC